MRAVVERSTQFAARDYPSIRVFHSHDELITQANIDLVVVSTPNTSHFDIAMSALQHGKHVVVDKPMAVSWEQAVALEAKAAQKRLVLSPYHNRRWDGDFKTLTSLLNSGVLGDVIRYESYFDRYRPQLRPGAWREHAHPGSGLFFDLGPHLLDQAFSLFGLPSQLSAEIRCERAGAVVDDAFDVSLAYSGLSVRLGASCLLKSPRPRFLVQGSRASFIKYGYDPQPDLLDQGERPGSPQWACESQANWGDLQEFSKPRASKIKTEAGDYRGYYENVRDAIAGEAPLQVTAVDGANTIRAIELARRSSQLNTSVAWEMPASL